MQYLGKFYVFQNEFIKYRTSDGDKFEFFVNGIWNQVFNKSKLVELRKCFREEVRS